MEYTIIAAGRSYDLPKKTIKIAEAIEKTVLFDRSQASIKEKYKAVLGCVQDILGKENADEILGGSKLEELDLSDITITFNKIVDAYEKPVEEFRSDQTKDRISMLPIDQMEALTRMAESMQK